MIERNFPNTGRRGRWCSTGLGPWHFKRGQESFASTPLQLPKHASRIGQSGDADIDGAAGHSGLLV